MGPDEIVAVVVSFNGGEKTVRTIRALLAQVGRVLVVDNASGTNSIDLLESLEAHPQVSVRFLKQNQGIAFALNLAVQHAREHGCRWLLTMDQDSLADATMIEEFGNAVRRNQDWACLTPTLVLRGARSTGFREDAPVSYAITSGNLVRLDVFEAAGMYDEALFVDQLDFDFSLRVRKAGFGIHRVGKALLNHELGDAGSPRSFLGRFHTFHSPLRRYYSYRNYLYLARRHARDFPGFIGKLALVHVLQLATITIYGRERFRSLRFICRGLLDFLRHRTGPYNEAR